MKQISLLGVMAFLCTTLSSCELVEGIFKAGVWAGVLLVVVVLALIIWLFAKVFGGRR